MMADRLLKALLRLGQGTAIALMLMFAIVAVDRAGLISHRNILDIGRNSNQANAAQGSGCMPTTGTVSGLTLVQDINAGIAALISTNSGSSAPATDCTALAIQGQLWLDTTSTPKILKQYDGSSWLVIGNLDSANHIWTPPLGGGTGTIASASTTDLGTIPQAYVSITGSTGITSFGSSAVAGTLKVLVFVSTPAVTYNATSMILPSGVSLTAAAGDVWIASYLGSGNWRVLSVQTAAGTALVNPARDVGDIWFSYKTAAPAKAVFGYGQSISRATYPDYVTATTIVQTGTSTNGSAVITGLSDTTQLGAGMNVEGTGIPAATTINSVDSSTQITLSANATASGTPSLTVFPNGYGAGGSNTTIGVPDCRGVMLAGRSNMGGTNNNNYTTAYAGVNGQALGVGFGSQNHTLTTAELAVHSHANSLNFPNTFNGATASGLDSFTGAGTQTPTSTVALSGTYLTITNANAGSGNPHAIVPPARIANCFVRVTL